MLRKWLPRIIVTVIGIFFLTVYYLLWNLSESGDERLMDIVSSFSAGEKPSSIDGLRDTPEHRNNIPANIPVVYDPRIDDSDSITRYSVVITVHSAINQSVRRDAIRTTWLSEPVISTDHYVLSVTYWFVIGAKDISGDDLRLLNHEQSKFNDLLMLHDVENGYHDLPLRTLRSLVYLVKHYHFTYLLKTDDDVYINIPTILHELSNIRPKRRLYWGRFACHNPPMKEGRWKEDGWRWCDVYFPYAYGGMYILTYDVVSLIADDSPFLQMYSCEDVSLGMWLAPYNVIRINDVRIFVQHSYKCSRGFIAVHIPTRQVSKAIHQLHESLKRKGVLCVALSYEDLLSWEGLPHKCDTDSLLVV